MKETVLQQFIRLLGEAHDASEEVDYFDLHSENAESVARWQVIILAQEASFKELTNFCAYNREVLITEFGRDYLKGG